MHGAKSSLSILGEVLFSIYKCKVKKFPGNVLFYHLQEMQVFK